jgi:hypothetical protein
MYPAVAIRLGAGEERMDALKLINRFLSSLSWVEGSGYTVAFISGGGLPRPMGREKTMGFSTVSEFNLTYFPEPTDKRAQLALALMREGRSLNHPAYSYLSYYRVLEVALPDVKVRKAWIEDAVDRVAGDRRKYRIKEVIERLRSNGIQSFETHLRETNRQAVAHGAREPIIDPDDPEHTQRMGDDIPLINGLAELAIEENLGIETPQTVWEKHLYELAGFKTIFGPDLVARFTTGEGPVADLAVGFPSVDIQIRAFEPYPILTGMRPRGVQQRGSTVEVLLGTNGGMSLCAGTINRQPGVQLA